MKIESINKTIGNLSNINCLICESKTQHIVLSSVERFGSYDYEYEDKLETTHFQDSYEIIQCKECKKIRFRHYHVSHDDDYDEETGPPDDLYEFFYSTAKLWPGRPEPLIIKKYKYLNPILSRLYEEVIDSYNNGILILCSFGIKQIIEIFLKNQIIIDSINELDNGNKYVKIFDENIYYEIDYTFLDNSSFLDNEEDHILKYPSYENLRILIEFAEIALMIYSNLREKKVKQNFNY